MESCGLGNGCNDDGVDGDDGCGVCSRDEVEIEAEADGGGGVWW